MTTELQILNEYIRSHIGYRGALDPEVDLLDAHILDSFSVIQLAVFVQEHFGIELEAEDLIRANLTTLSNMVALIERRRAASRA